MQFSQIASQCKHFYSIYRNYTLLHLQNDKNHKTLRHGTSNYIYSPKNEYNLNTICIKKCDPFQMEYKIYVSKNVLKYMLPISIFNCDSVGNHTLKYR